MFAQFLSDLLHMNCSTTMLSCFSSQSKHDAFEPLREALGASFSAPVRATSACKIGALLCKFPTQDLHANCPPKFSMQVSLLQISPQVYLLQASLREFPTQVSLHKLSVQLALCKFVCTSSQRKFLWASSRSTSPCASKLCMLLWPASSTAKTSNRLTSTDPRRESCGNRKKSQNARR